eukprot:2493666-Pleurochrysis_carterae.AAC.1
MSSLQHPTHPAFPWCRYLARQSILPACTYCSCPFDLALNPTAPQYVRLRWADAELRSKRRDSRQAAGKRLQPGQRMPSLSSD